MTINPELAVLNTAQKVFQNCTVDELYALYLGHLTGVITSETEGYEKVKFLLTENNGTKFHNLVFQALSQIINELT